MLKNHHSQLFSALLFSAFTFFISGCALSPQLITLSPEIQVEAQALGKHRTVFIQVVDRRKNATIGSRGGVYSGTNNITIANDFKTGIAETLATTLAQYNFTAHINNNADNTDNATNKNSAISFILFIDSIVYTPSPSMIGKVALSANLSIKVEYNNAKYNGAYAADSSFRSISRPSDEKNSLYINQVFNLALQQVFDDESLMSFLKKQM